MSTGAPMDQARAIAHRLDLAMAQVKETSALASAALNGLADEVDHAQEFVRAHMDDPAADAAADQLLGKLKAMKDQI